MPRHIKTTRDEDDRFQTTNECLVCGVKNFISDCAGPKRMKANFQWFAAHHEKCGEKFKTSEIEQAKAKVAEILTSPHVARVEIGLDERSGNVRYYTAITKDKGVPHRYRVRVEDSFETGERITSARCNCQGSSKGFVCRHIAAVAKIDSANMKREIFPFELANYNAYRYQKAA